MTRPKQIELTFNMGPGSGFWSSAVLDTHVAPELSELTTCSAPEIPDPPNYFAMLFLNSVLNSAPFAETERPLVIAFLRRWQASIREYRAGRELLLKYVSDLPRTNNQLSVYLTALSHLEHCVINAFVALRTMERIVKDWSQGRANGAFEKNDGSPADRLRELYDSVRHFNERAVAGRPTEYPAPMWITNAGLKCRGPRRNGSRADVVLSFVELTEFLNDLTANARFYADPAYRSERLSALAGTTC